MCGRSAARSAPRSAASISRLRSSDDVVAELRDAFTEHQVLFFRDQDLSVEAQLAFGRRFGELGTHPYVAANPDHPEVLDIVTEPDDRVNFGGGWHSDVTFLEEPDLGSILYAVDVPDARRRHAVRQPGRGLRGAQPDDARAARRARRRSTRPARSTAVAATRSAARRWPRAATSTAAASRVEHPVVRTHPETGRKSLYVNQAFTIGIKGMSRPESAALLGFLFEHATAEPFTCRFRWQHGSVAMWDNRSVQHYALHDYRGQRRVMRRITVQRRPAALTDQIVRSGWRRRGRRATPTPGSRGAAHPSS